jgi:hypothetical protein
MQNEQWKDIPGYEGLYQVSNLGRIKSFKNNREKILGAYRNQGGYCRVCLSKNKDEKKWLLIHTLVANAFLPNPNNLPEIDHIDENPANNTVANLRWCTRGFNAYRTRKPVVQVKEDGTVKIWNSTVEAVEIGGYGGSQISRCCNKNGKSKKHRGSHWYWLKDYNPHEM